ncbi:MAG: Holliday junction branch migration protein RuvA [Gemmatimonadaceae bacterium]|nr:Holliday junction branch migration protein RuvA [Gemmatimonadaceae bacterium]
MIARIAGTLLHVELDRIEVMTSGGVGYELLVPLSVIEALPRPGEQIALHTALVVREDASILFGFQSAEERKLFQRLLGTTGVGPQLALNILSTLSPARLAAAVRDGDLATLTRVPRVGKKLAERLLLELRDKNLEATISTAAGGGASGGTHEAARALQALGYAAPDAERAVKRALDGGADGKDTAALIRQALATLSA